MTFTVGLGQVGEFAFVLFAFIAQLKIISAELSDIMMGATAITMTLTPLLLLINERLILPHFGTKEAADAKLADVISRGSNVIIGGFCYFGSTIGRFLRANGFAATILDNDSDRVDLLRRMGFTVFYGDATRLDILKSAGADSAKILIVAIDAPETNLDLVEKTRKVFPNLKIMVRAKNNLDAYNLLHTGIEDVYRESIDTSVRFGVDVLVKLGVRRYTATRAGQLFIKYDEASFRQLAQHRHDQEAYLVHIREQIALQEELLDNDRKACPNLHDFAWDMDAAMKKK
jgi:CPA2 family monovalent cation:H+ antiporter-2